MKVLFLDTACFAFARRDPHSAAHWKPHCARVAAIMEDTDVPFMPARSTCNLIRPQADWEQSADTLPYHKADAIDFKEASVSASVAANDLKPLMEEAELIVAHLAGFHQKVLRALFTDAGDTTPASVDGPWFDTLTQSMPVVKLPTKNDRGYKQPKLTEAYRFFSGVDMPVHATWYPFGMTNAKAVRLIYKGLQKRKDD
jgi:DNA polymerase-3 subunit epsilon